jgi:LmbE family N-acetylglucosaminyl deacetylase
MKLLISPHDDDQHLFASFTCIRERPLVVVVTDSYIQPNRGEKGCSAEERHEESRRACEITGCPLITLGLRDDRLLEEDVRAAFHKFFGFKVVYAPTVQGGNWQHDLIGRIAREVWGASCIGYPTYTKTELYTTGTEEIRPTAEENSMKNRALDCYVSQLRLGSTAPHFAAVRNRSEWLIP